MIRCRRTRVESISGLYARHSRDKSSTRRIADAGRRSPILDLVTIAVPTSVFTHGPVMEMDDTRRGEKLRLRRIELYQRIRHYNTTVV